jgi:molybdenum cofactor biosynthesis enzyme MoaA
MRETTSYILEDAIRARHDRAAHFQKGLEYLSQNAIRGLLQGRPYRFHWNINLYVELASWCNGKCWFCINRVNYRQEDTSDERFVASFDEVVRRVRFLDPTVQLAGGEPTILPDRTRAVVELIRRHRLRKPVMTCNGSGLVRDGALLDDLAPVLAHINISRHHDDERQLNALMGFHNPLDNASLAEIVRGHPIGEKLRLNCCLQVGGIETAADVHRYLEWALGMGVRNVCFSTLSRLPGDYMYQEEFVRLAGERYADLGPVVDAITGDPRFTFLKFHTGSHCMYEVWRYTHRDRTCVVVFATSDNNFARALDDVDDLIELLVLHADGVLAGSWNRHRKVMA